MNEPDVPEEPAAPPATPPTPVTEPFIATFRGLWARLKEHKVVQWTLAYLAIAYTLLHGAEMLAGTLNWSHGLLRIFTLILIRAFRSSSRLSRRRPLAGSGLRIVGESN